MEVLQNFKNLFFDVWNKGISGINISEIIIALLIFLFFLFLRGVFSKFVVKRLENYVSKSTNNFDNSLVFSMEGPVKFFPIVIGFFGVIMIMKPTSDVFVIYSIFPILVAFCWSLSMIVLKFIPENISTAKIQFYSLFFSIVGAIILYFISSDHQPIENIFHLFLMVMTGILGGTGGILFIYAYRLMLPSKLAPFEYLGIPSSFILGWVFFKEAPIDQLFPGVLAIVLAGMIIIWRDAKKENLQRDNKKFY